MLTLASCSCQDAVTAVFSKGDGIGNVPVVLWGTVQLMGHVRRGAAAQGVTLPKPVWSSTRDEGINSVWRPKRSPHSCQNEAQLMMCGLSPSHVSEAGLGPHTPAVPLHPPNSPSRYEPSIWFTDEETVLSWPDFKPIYL